MSVTVDSTGRRSVEVEVEAPGTVEAVWAAVATGPGISAWFVPTEFHQDGRGTPWRVVSHFGPEMDAEARILLWEPPHRFQAASADLGPEAPEVTTEWRVTAHAGGGCTVRVSHALQTESPVWDATLAAWEGGWPDFFRILRLYLRDFSGMPCSSFQLVTPVEGTPTGVWERLTGLLGLEDVAVGAQHDSHPDAPPLAGVVEMAGEGEYPEQLLLRLQTPAPGLGHLFALALGGRVHLVLRFYFYGDAGREALIREEPVWRRWLSEHFPPGETAHS